MAHKIEPERNYLAQKLREAREYLGLSQEYVSQQTNIPRPAVSEIEAGRRRVESLELRRLARLYGRPLSYFLPDEQEVGSPKPSTSLLRRGRGKQAEVETKLRNMTKDLPSEDREEILRFAEYLRHKKLVARSAKEG